MFTSWGMETAAVYDRDRIEDILEELELEIPQTWQELIEMLPTIQGNNMSVGIPSAGGTSSGTAATATTSGDLSMYFSLLFQYGGDLYNEAGTETVVNNEAGVEAFSDYVKYFTDYGIPTIYDFVSRFRSGEMPIGIANYTTYNTLMVSAPEIRGLWDFTLIPGTEIRDGEGKSHIDRSDFITGSATMMVRTKDDGVRQNAWEFMKWWASSDDQTTLLTLPYHSTNPNKYSKISLKALLDHVPWPIDSVPRIPYLILYTPSVIFGRYFPSYIGPVYLLTDLATLIPIDICGLFLHTLPEFPYHLFDIFSLSVLLFLLQFFP